MAYAIVFLNYDTEQGIAAEVKIDGLPYEPKAVRQSLSVELVGPFDTKAEAQKYHLQNYKGYADRTIIQELPSPAEDTAELEELRA